MNITRILLASLGAFDPKKVTGLLDALPQMDASQRTVLDQGLMLILSACLLQERFGLTA